MNTNRADIRVKGKSVVVRSTEIDDRTVIISGRWLKKSVIKDEDLIEGETFTNLESFLSRLKVSGLNADILSFSQRLPDTRPKHNYHIVWDNLAVIPITSFSDWWENLVESSVRRAVRRSSKLGLVVKQVQIDDEFISGIVSINDETPIRQGKPFWHFKKSFEAVKAENSTYADRNIFFGAYFENELVGYIRLTRVGSVWSIIQILGKVKHFDKRPLNALIAKAVECCEQTGASHLLYCNYVYNDPKSSLTEFKRRNGFRQVLVPRYFVPLTYKGKVALKLGIYDGFVKLIPKPVVAKLLRIRSLWYERKLRTHTEVAQES
ncbi:MAG TPA: hypothetical protein VMC85_13585 [Desulfomonilaceae bacterium]|nr:hypothetical protein [Desulfomonilaceae bacterium]